MVQILQVLLRFIQLILLVRNQKAEGSDLLVDIFNLLVEEKYLLVNDVFLVDHVDDLVFVLLILPLDLRHLILQILLVLLQRVDLLFDLAGGCRVGFCGDQAQDHAQQHHRRQDAGHHRYP